MQVSFKVKTINSSFDVYIQVDGKTVSITSFKASDEIEAKIPELVAKAKSNSLRALALENALNQSLAIGA